MKRASLAALVVLLCAACGDVRAASTASVGSNKPIPIVRVFTAADMAAGRAFLAAHAESDQVGGHEMDGFVLAAVRQNAKANSLRLSLLDRDGNIWVIDPISDSNADTIAAWVGKGDWVIWHIHQRDGFTSEAWTPHDFRLVAKAAA